MLQVKPLLRLKNQEIIQKYFLRILKFQLRLKKTKNYDYIEIEGKKNFKSFNYNIPGDISSSAFFIVLTLLSQQFKINY